MGTHPIFESDFDCLTESKDQRTNHHVGTDDFKRNPQGAQRVGYPDRNHPSLPRHASLSLWDLASGNTTRRFVGHTKDVLSVAFSADNRQIVSAARDRTIKLWNTLGICKYTIQEQGHSEWVSRVRFSPLPQNPVIVSSGWDKLVKVWNLSNCKLKRDYRGHTGYLNTVTVSPDGSLCASGGRDGQAKLWDLGSGETKPLHTLDGGEELKPEVMGQPPQCISICWSSDGQTLFSGYTDGLIRVWSLSVRASALL